MISEIATLNVDDQSPVASLGFASLRVVGNRSLVTNANVAICGSRDVTESGLDLAMAVGKACADRGVTLVAGDAKGVDDAAEAAALRAGGSVVAVLAEGIEKWRPRASYREWIDSDSSNFAAVSQFGDSDRWQVFRAMTRNKTVIALSAVLFVVEARLKGGTYEAGLAALRMKHPVCVLGDSEDNLSDGGRDLVRRGAQFLSPDQILSIVTNVMGGSMIAAGQQGSLAL